VPEDCIDNLLIFNEFVLIDKPGWTKNDQDKTRSLSGWDCYSLQICSSGEGSDMATKP
jgi:hypothetical protein